MTKQEIINLAKRAGACSGALIWASSPEASWENIRPYWAYWLRVYCGCDLDRETKRRAEEAACRSPQWAFETRAICEDLDEDGKRKTEQAACRSPQWACRLRLDCLDLSEESKRLAEEAACGDAYWASVLLAMCEDLDPESKRKAREARRNES